jgi:hypothetical protein
MRADLGTLIALGAAGLLLTAGCAAPRLGLGPPPVPVPGETVSGLPASPAPSGLTLVADPTAPGEFVAALLFRGGPINDPPSLPGLTEWMVEAALLGTRGHDPVTLSPHERALALGGTLEPVANGALAGWMVFGPRAHADAFLALLQDVALSPSFPATRLSMSIAMNREALATREDALIERAIAIALGQSLGLGRPLYMYAPNHLRAPGPYRPPPGHPGLLRGTHHRALGEPSAWMGPRWPSHRRRPHAAPR